MRENKVYNKNHLVESFHQGHESAFSQIFRELYPSMTLYALRFIEQQAVAEDIAEEAFVKAWEKRETFFEFRTLCSWLYATTRNASIDWLRHQEVENKSVTVIRERYNEPEANSLEHLVQAELLRELGQALYRLPQQQQKIVRSFYLEEQSLQEIADQMRLSIHTVKSQKARGLATLRKWISLMLYFSLLWKFIL